MNELFPLSVSGDKKYDLVLAQVLDWLALSALSISNFAYPA